MAYTKYNTNKSSSGGSPKKGIHTFRDLEVYQKTMECSVIIMKDLRSTLIKLDYVFVEKMILCSMTIPLWVGESHSVRYENFNLGISTLEKAMAGCNKMVIYLEQIKGVYGSKLNIELIDDITNRYITTRSKMYRLEKAWRRYQQIDLAQTGQKESAKSFKY